MMTPRKDPFASALRAAGLSDRDARRLAGAGTPIEVKSGVQLCAEGDYGAEAFVLVNGGAKVMANGQQIRTVNAGEVLGEIAALDPLVRRTATVETTEKSIVLVYDVRTFRALAADMGDVLTPDRAA